MRVLACRLDIAWEDKPANFAKASGLVAAAECHGGTPLGPEPGSLIVLPEMFATGFSMDAEKIGEEMRGATATFLGELASRHGCGVAGGVASACLRGGRQACAGRFFNEMLAVSPSGAEIARYRKMHLFSPAGENEHYTPGEGPVVFEYGGFRVAPFICYDLRFPEDFRAAAPMGADLVVVIASWPAARLDHWVTLLCARAIESEPPPA